LAGTKWDIYYYIKFEIEDNGVKPDYTQILERFKKYDKKIIDDGIRLYKEINES
jgi:hypothetical protein